jgi:hypothetical protein
MVTYHHCNNHILQLPKQWSYRTMFSAHQSCEHHLNTHNVSHQIVQLSTAIQHRLTKLVPIPRVVSKRCLVWKIITLSIQWMSKSSCRKRYDKEMHHWTMGVSLFVLKLHRQKMAIWNKNLVTEWLKIQTLNVCFWAANFRGAKPACLYRLPESSHVSTQCNIGMLHSLQYRHRHACSGYAEEQSIEPHLWIISTREVYSIQHLNM